MPKKIIPIPAGMGYFTCSAIPALYNCGYTTQLDLYEKYKGIVRDAKLSEEALNRMEFGKFFEDSVAQFFCKKMGLKVKKMGDGLLAYWKKDMPYFICHPDRLGIGKDGKGRRFALEVKCVSPHAYGWGEDGSNEIPDMYYIQVQGYFACGVPCDVVYVAAMKGNAVFIYEILPDWEVVEDIRNRVKAAKESFDKDIMPDPSNWDEAFRTYKYKMDPLKEGMPAGDAGRALWDEMLANHKVLTDAKNKEEQLKSKMVTMMNGCPCMTIGDEKGKVTAIAKLTESHTKSFDYKTLEKEMPGIYMKYERENTVISIKFAWPREKKEN